MSRRVHDPQLPDLADGPFVAIDFETADRYPDSACAVGLVRVEEGEIVDKRLRYIRPPRAIFEFTPIHDITWDDVAGEPVFGEVWPELEPLLEGAQFLAAHNAPFDRKVLAACCAMAGLPPPPLQFICTVRLARRTWRLRRVNLPAVCDHIGFHLRHHHALSDAEACARIVMAAAEVAVR